MSGISVKPLMSYAFTRKCLNLSEFIIGLSLEVHFLNITPWFRPWHESLILCVCCELSIPLHDFVYAVLFVIIYLMSYFVSGLLITGIVVISLPMPGIQAFVFFIAGFICFIPGAYHVVYIYWAVKGKRGYDFYHLPLFNWLCAFLTIVFFCG